MYYGILTAATLLFSIQFVFNQRFQRAYGSDLRAMLVFSAGSGLAGFFIVLAINGFRLEFTPFTLLMATLASLDAMAFTFCGLKALDRINLSLYSIYAMLGGMALPFVVGIAVYGEALTPGKAICFLLITAALFMGRQKGEKRGGGLWYAGIFILNGLSSVITQVFNEGALPKTSGGGYTILCCVTTIVLSLALLPLTRGQARPLSRDAIIGMAGNGIANRLAGLLVLIALAHLPASAQYSFITGGTMIFSTMWSFFGKDRPTKMELAAVGVSFAGILALTVMG